MTTSEDMLAEMLNDEHRSIEDYPYYERAAFFDDLAKECPFCKGRVVWNKRRKSYTIRCVSCGARGPKNRRFVYAFLKWNAAPRD